MGTWKEFVVEAGTNPEGEACSFLCVKKPYLNYYAIVFRQWEIWCN